MSLPENAWDSKNLKVTLALLAILLLAGALRVYDLGGESVWVDEAISVADAHRPLGEIFFQVPSKTPNLTPPLHTIFLKGWISLLGDSPVAIRAPSVAFGIAAVAIVFLVGLELGGAGLGLAGAFLSAISYFLIRYSQEARMYSLLVLLSAASYYFFTRMVRRGEKGFAVTGSAVCTVLLLYTHQHGAFIPLAQGVTLLCLWRRTERVRLRWLSGQALAAVAFAPWLPTLAKQIKTVVSWSAWWIPVPGLSSFWSLNRVWVATYYYVIGRIAVLPYATTAFFWALVVAGLLLKKRSRGALPPPAREGPAELAHHEVTVVLTFWLLMPIAATTALSSVGPSIFVDRYMIGVVPALYLLAARGIVAPDKRWLAVVFCLAVLAFNVPVLHDYYRKTDKNPWDKVARLIKAEGSPGDLVVTASTVADTPFIYYYRGPLEHLIIREYRNNPAQTSERLREVTVGRKRLWLIHAHAPHETGLRVLEEIMPNGLKAWYKFRGVRVFLYEVPPGLRKGRSGKPVDKPH